MADNSQNALNDLKRRLGVHDHHQHSHASHFSGADSVGGGSGGDAPDSPGGGLSLGDDSTLASIDSESVASQVSEYSLAPFIAEMVGASLAARLDPLPKVSAAAQEDRLLRCLMEETRTKHAQKKISSSPKTIAASGGDDNVGRPTAKAVSPTASLTSSALPMPLPAGVMCAGRVPWGAAHYFEVLVDDPNAILTLNLVATAAVNPPGGIGGGASITSSPSLPILTANPNAHAAPSEHNRNNESSALAKSALGRAILAEPIGGSISSGLSHNRNDTAAPSPIWTIEEVARRRPASLAKADLFVRKVRPHERQEEERGARGKGARGTSQQRLPSPSDFDWKSCSTGPKDRLVIYPGLGGRRGCEGGAGR